jgi:hypothetical protein
MLKLKICMAKSIGKCKVEEKLQNLVCLQNYANKIRQANTTASVYSDVGWVGPISLLMTAKKKAYITTIFIRVLGPRTYIHAWTK